MSSVPLPPESLSTIERMLKALPHVYAKSSDSNTRKLLSIPARELDVLLLELATIQDWEQIDHARGQTLDLIGTNVREPRGSKDDVQYRIYLKLRQIVNLSRGEIERFNTVLNILLGDAYLGIREGWNDPISPEPAQVIIGYDNDLLSSDLRQQYRIEYAPAYVFDGTLLFDGTETWDTGETYLPDGTLIKIAALVTETIQHIRDFVNEVKAAGVGLYWETPRYPITTIPVDNESIVGANLSGSTDTLPTQDVLRAAGQEPVLPNPPHTWIGVYSFNGSVVFDGVRDSKVSQNVYITVEST
ncbi:MAG: hypothetical protein JRD89_02800 [Deltaproteobacteria bacterium]|nr:hypothetical protein [Deltaproteobacteria bacterium]